jgi:hypothetical protein
MKIKCLLSTCILLLYASPTVSAPKWSGFSCTQEQICVQYANNNPDFCFGGNFRASYRKTNPIEIWASEYVRKDSCRLRLNSLITNQSGDFIVVKKSNFSE